MSVRKHTLPNNLILMVVIPAVITSLALIIFAKQFFDDTDPLTEFVFTERGIGVDLGVLFYINIIGPIKEEIICRGICQHAIKHTQELANELSPQYIKTTRLFKWLVSPSARIIAVNTHFALAPCSNIRMQSTAATVGQVGMLLVLPAESILQETTGNIATPIIYHILHNNLGTVGLFAREFLLRVKRLING